MVIASDHSGDKARASRGQQHVCIPAINRSAVLGHPPVAQWGGGPVSGHSSIASLVDRPASPAKVGHVRAVPVSR